MSASRKNPHVVPIERHHPYLIEKERRRRDRERRGPRRLRDAAYGEPCAFWRDVKLHARIPKSIARDPGIPTGEKVVFAACCKAFGFDNRRELSPILLAELTGASQRRVWDCLRAFVDRGWLVRFKTTGRLVISDDAGDARRFLKLPSAVLAVSKLLSSSEKLVLSCVIDLAGKKDHWFGTDAALAEGCGLEKHSVARALRSLHRKGFVSVERDGRRRARSHGRGATVIRTLKHPIFTREAAGYGA